MNHKFQEYFINHWVGLADMWAYSHQPRIATFNNTLTDQPGNNMEQYDSYVRKVSKVISSFIHSCPVESLPAFCADIEMCIAEQLKKYTDLSMPPVKVLPNSSHSVVHFKSRFRDLDECCQVYGTDEPLPWFICQRCGSSSHAECIPSTSSLTTCPRCHGPLDSSDMQY